MHKVAGRLEEGTIGFWDPLPRDRTRRDGDHVNSLSVPAAPTATATAAAANRAPTVPPPPPAALNLPCSSLPPRYSQRFAEAETCGNFGSSSSWQWRSENTTTAAVRAAFAHREAGLRIFLLLKNPSCRVPDGELCAVFSFATRTTRSSVRWFAPDGVRKVYAEGMRGKRLAASTLECQFKFWNDISPPKKNGILWGVHARLGIPAPYHHLVLKHGEVRGKKGHNKYKLLMKMYFWAVVNSSI